MVIRWLRDQRGSVALAPTLRRDPWWLEILPTIALLGGFAIYATWAALQNAHYFAAPYLSPFYSPCLSSTCAHVSLPLVGRWWTLSPAFLILWIPGGLRATWSAVERSAAGASSRSRTKPLGATFNPAMSSISESSVWACSATQSWPGRRDREDRHADRADDDRRMARGQADLRRRDRHGRRDAGAGGSRLESFRPLAPA